MKTARKLLFLTLMVFLPLSVSIAEEKAATGAPPAPTTVYQAKFPIALPSGEFELASMILDFAPGAGMPMHKHGGHVLVVLLSGEMTLREKGTERIMKPGDSWTENPGDEHSVINAGDVAARVAVSMLLPKGAEATTLVK